MRRQTTGTRPRTQTSLRQGCTRKGDGDQWDRTELSRQSRNICLRAGSVSPCVDLDGPANSTYSREGASTDVILHRGISAPLTWQALWTLTSPRHTQALLIDRWNWQGARRDALLLRHWSLVAGDMEEGYGEDWEQSVYRMDVGHRTAQLYIHLVLGASFYYSLYISTSCRHLLQEAFRALNPRNTIKTTLRLIPGSSIHF